MPNYLQNVNTCAKENEKVNITNQSIHVQFNSWIIIEINPGYLPFQSLVQITITSS